MGLFNSKPPQVEEIQLEKDYRFMYENFVFSTQQKLYLLLEENNGLIDALTFDASIYKYGYPNDEIGHPLQKHGLGFYDFYQVHNSAWIQELLELNRKHPSHQDGFFDDRHHYVAKFKDVTLEVVCRGPFQLIQISVNQMLELLKKEIELIKKRQLT